MPNDVIIDLANSNCENDNVNTVKSAGFFDIFTPLPCEGENYFDGKFARKSPTSFISTDDWNLYVRICCHLKLLQSTGDSSDIDDCRRILNSSGANKRESCAVRLVSAFNRLYQEYSMLFDAYEAMRKKSICDIKNVASDVGDTVRKRSHSANNRKISKRNNHVDGDRITEKSTLQSYQSQTQGTLKNLEFNSICISTEATLPVRSQTYAAGIPSDSTPPFVSDHSQTLKIEDANFLSHQDNCTRSCYHCCCTNKKKLDLPGPNSPNVYDCIQRQPPAPSIWVNKIARMDLKIEHVVPSLGTWSGNTNTNRIPEPIRLPICLELTLPRMQSKIESIMSACKFLYDPLEVASELRTLNYDTNACILYFEKIREYREIINEFLPTRLLRQETSNRSQIFGTNETNSAHINIKECDFVDFIKKYQEKLAFIRKSQIDASRRIERLRVFASGLSSVMTNLIESAVDVTVACPGGSHEKGNNAALYGQVSKLTAENSTLKETLRLEEQRRKSVFNMMQEYLGNIRVFCRCRLIPQSSRCLEVSSFDTVLLNNGSNLEEYKFDRVFDTKISQEEIFSELLPLVHSFQDGFNVCFLTYGGEASGKTFTLLGGGDESEDSQGIVQRSLCTVLANNLAKQNDWETNLTVAVVEVYNDTFVDLLSGETGIHLRVDLGVDRMMESLKSIPVESHTDISELLKFCKSKRRVGKTALNPVSSRSHLIMLAKLRSNSQLHETKLSSVLALCDLAGFEDIIKADTLGDPTLAKEAGFINRSLSALNRVFASLRTQDPMAVSYRDSKLTYLLKPFFINSGKCILLVTVRTDRANLPSTQGTLRFGRDSRAVSLGRARRHVSIERLIQDGRAI